jgi:hypothetical protein
MSTQTITQPICGQSFADVHDTFNSDMIAVNFIVEENHSSPKTVADQILPPTIVSATPHDSRNLIHVSGT